MEVLFSLFLYSKRMKVRNIIIVFITSICLSSCLMTNFSTVHNTLNISAGYPAKKWLFVTSDAPASLQQDFDEQIIQFLGSCYGANFVNYKENRNKHLLPNLLYEADNDLFISQLNRVGEINFYLNVKAEVLRSDVGALDLNYPPSRGVSSYDETRIKVTFEVIDVFKKESVYSQSVIGTTSKNESHRQDVLLSLPMNNQFKKAFKRALNNFKKDFPCK